MVTEASTNPDRQSAFFCADGRVHEWTYLRDADKTYRCNLCVGTITKTRLKELTDA